MSRMKVKVAARAALMLAVVLTLGFAGCGGAKTGGGGGGGSAKSSGGSRGGSRAKPLSEAEQAQLDEARKAAEAAERKLSDLRLERAELEKGGAQ